MRGFCFYAVLCALIPFSAAAAESEAAGKAGADYRDSSSRHERLDSAVVSVSRAGEATPVTYTMVGRQQLREGSPLNSLPMTLNLQPSVVAVNEGGTGIGYSKMTIRGTKGSQINVTLNGITLNDAESQEVFWVNIPALGNLLSSVQVQRGLGTSANGSGAFGASINMSTASVGADPYASADIAYGSYNTFTSTVAAGSGLTRSGIYFDAAYSKNITDGYIRNAKANVQSAYAALGWLKGNNSLKLTWLMGEQHTGITWNGIDLDTYGKDRRYNSAGEYYDAFGNVRYYDNDTDNYVQHHLQLNYTHQFPKNVIWSTTANFTKGDGYYENYKAGKKFSKYGFGDDFSFERDGNVYTAKSYGDFIVRKSMDNYYLVLNSDVKYSGEKVNVTGGVNVSRYSGDHFGELVWSDVLGDGYDYLSRNAGDASNAWYFNNGLKQEVNLFARAEYAPVSWITAYMDLQYRGVWLKMDGIDDDNLGKSLDYSTMWNFFNPRAGITLRPALRHKVYASAALGNREPGRADIKEVVLSYNDGDTSIELKPEKMVDVEIGYEYSAPKITASANLYFMEYFDMLLETGRLSDSGYAIKENVGRGFRRGIELAAAWKPVEWFKAEANATLSLNKLAGHTEYIANIDENWDETGRLTPVEYGKTDMLMSPSVIGMVRLSFSPFRTIARNSLRTTTISIDGKYVGKQYLDNTSAESRSIPRYFVSNLSVTHEFSLKRGAIGLGGYINNLFNNMYYADGWCWKNMSEADGAVYDGIGIFPQAPMNFMFKVSYRFR